MQTDHDQNGRAIGPVEQGVQSAEAQDQRSGDKDQTDGKVDGQVEAIGQNTNDAELVIEHEVEEGREELALELHWQSRDQD